MMRKRLTHRYEKIKEAATGNLRREISDDFKYDKKKLKYLKKVLHNVTVALGTLSSALNSFSRLKGRDISPDGMLGGLGYIMSLKQIREILSNSVQGLSDIADSIADEFTNPKWNVEDDADIKKLLKEKEKVEEKVEESEQQESEDIDPEDVITSNDIEKMANQKKSEDKFANYIRKSLVSFNSVGKNKTPKRRYL